MLVVVLLYHIQQLSKTMFGIFIFTKSSGSVCMMGICIYSRMLWRVIRCIAINCKVPLCHANQLNPQKTFPLHFIPDTKGPVDIMSVIISLTQVWVLTSTRLEITLQCWLSTNNRLEASKGGWCLKSLFFLYQPWLPARKNMPSPLLCTKRASQARILLSVRLHLNLSDHPELQEERFNCCEEGFRVPKKLQPAPWPSHKIA